MLAGRKWQRGDVGCSTDITTLEKCCSCLETRVTLSAYRVEKRLLLLFPSNLQPRLRAPRENEVLRRTGRSYLRTLVAVLSLRGRLRFMGKSSVGEVGGNRRFPRPASFIFVSVDPCTAHSLSGSLQRCQGSLFAPDRRLSRPPKLKGMTGARGRDAEPQTR